jgi:phosphoribosylanthranilate isomerase
MAGADVVGLNFVGGPRRVQTTQAGRILDALRAPCAPVALVRVHPTGLEPEVEALLRSRRIGHLQLYGDVTPTTVSGLSEGGFRVLVVCRLPTGDVRRAIDRCLGGIALEHVFGLVLDAPSPDALGGTGRRLDWDAVGRACGEFGKLPRLVLAGGLTPQNVAEAVALVRPWGVDVSSGVESSPGRKDPRAMEAFVRAAKASVRSS